MSDGLGGADDEDASSEARCRFAERSMSRVVVVAAAVAAFGSQRAGEIDAEKWRELCICTASFANDAQSCLVSSKAFRFHSACI